MIIYIIMKIITYIITFLALTLHILLAEEDLMKKADNYFAKGKFSLAEVFYKKAIQDSPEDFHANFNLGKIYFIQRDHANTVKYMERAYDIDPKNEILFYIGNSYVNNDQPEKGLSTYSNLIRKDPDYADVYLNAGNIGLKKLYNKYLTIVHWEKFLEIRPDDPQAPNIRKALEYLRDPNFILRPPKDGNPATFIDKSANGDTSTTNIPIFADIKGKDLKSKAEEKYNLKNKKTITTE